MMTIMMMMMMTMKVAMQVDPTETDKWTKVKFISDKYPIQASMVVVYIYSESSMDVRISDVTVDACIGTYLHLHKCNRCC